MSSQSTVAQDGGGGFLHWVNVKFSQFTKFFRTSSEKVGDVSPITRARAFAASAAASAAAAKATAAAAAAAAVSNPSSFASLQATAAAAQADVIASAASSDAAAALNEIPALVQAHATAVNAYSAASASIIDPSAVVGVEAGRAEATLLAAKAAEEEMKNACAAVTVGVCLVESYANAAAEAAGSGAASYAQMHISAPPDVESGGAYVSCYGLLSCRAKIGPSVACVVKVFLGTIILGSLAFCFMKIVFEGKTMFHRKH